jgi:hypothetical protein
MFDLCDSDETPYRETIKSKISTRLDIHVQNGETCTFSNFIEWYSVDLIFHMFLLQCSWITILFLVRTMCIM